MFPPPRNSRLFAALISFIALSSMASAQESNEDQPPDPDTGESTVAERTLGVLPNPLQKNGIKFAVTYIGEALGNATGGLQQGAVIQGRANFAVDVDFEKLTGSRGLIAHANVFGIHGDGLSRSNLKNYFVTSGIEALPSLRLYEAYLEQKWNGDRLSIRFGQFAADSEFLSTKYTDVFTNASLGWPAITALNLPSGGPSPPLAALGVRLFAKLSDNITFLSAIFDGDPAGPGANDPQERNRYGLNFRISDPPLTISEIQVSWKGFGSNQNLPGDLKLGGWAHFGSFNDQRFDVAGNSLASPSSSGMAAQLRGDHGIYAVWEQRVYSVPNNDNRGIGVFARASSSPADRNVIDLYADVGVDFIGLSNTRPNDKFGIAGGYAHVSKRAQALDADFRALANGDWPVRTSEAMITTAYQYEVQSGWNLVPNFQYILRPGGGATDPLSTRPGLRLSNAAVFGLRSVTKF